MVAKLTVKGQVTIPKPLRRLVGLITEPVDVDAYLTETRGPPWSADRDGEEHRRADR